MPSLYNRAKQDLKKTMLLLLKVVFNRVKKSLHFLICAYHYFYTNFKMSSCRIYDYCFNYKLTLTPFLKLSYKGYSTFHEGMLIVTLKNWNKTLVSKE